MSKFLDARFLDLKPYTPGEQLRGKKIIKLNTNESPYPPSPAVQEAVCRETGSLHLYPEITGGALLPALAQLFGVERENIFAGNGSDEVLAFIFQALCPNGAAFADLTYGFYPVYAKLYQLATTIIPLRKDLSLQIEDYRQAGKTIFIANPNAPTGLAISRAEVEKLLQYNRDTLVVIDEAYVDFGAESSVPLLRKYDNLLVVGTFSKSRSLAGGRLGFAVGSKALIADLEKIKFSFNPYNLNQMTIAAGAAALMDGGYYAACQKNIIETRDKSIKQLQSLGFTCTNSKANFIFCRHKCWKAADLYTKLKEQNILVRWFNADRIDNYLRITVGSGAEMNALHDALHKIILEGGI